MSKVLSCIVCGSMESTVRDTKSVNEGLAVERRRTCQNCGTRYITIETFHRIVAPRKNRVNQPKIVVKQQDLFE